jgi:sugar transferase (PEP-CTERM system associated)
MPTIFNKYYPATKLFLFLGEGIFIVASILLAMRLRFGADFSLQALNPYTWSKILLMASVCQLSLYYHDLYDLRVTDTYQELGLRLIQSLGIAAIILAVIYYAFPLTMLGRGIFLISIVFVVIFICSWRYLYSWVLKKRMFSEKIMLIGSGELARNIVDEIMSRKDSGYQISSIIDNPAADLAGGLEGCAIFPDFNVVCEQASKLSVQKIVVALDEKRGKFPTEQLMRCKMNGIKIVEGESFYENLTGRILVERINPSWLIFSEGFRKSRATRIVKRLSGLIISSLGLLIAAPLITVISLAIKLDSKGPVIFRQARCGEDGKSFRICKFRSMVHDAEETCGPVWADDDDCRITRVGRILRKLRLDEIPQMWNVLKGDMSFVGPRPERPEFVEELQRILPYYSERHTVKPGITGWAQVSCGYGASVEDALEKLKYDLFYIKNMSFLLDLIIIFRTIKIVLQQRGSR